MDVRVEEQLKLQNIAEVMTHQSGRIQMGDDVFVMEREDGFMYVVPRRDGLVRKLMDDHGDRIVSYQSQRLIELGSHAWLNRHFGWC